MTSDVDAILAHAGVKGMKWGVRKSDDTPDTRSKVQKWKDLEKEMPLHNNRGSWEGGLLRNHYQNKEINKLKKKDSSFDFNKVGGDERKAIQQRIQRRAMTDLATRTAGEAVGAVLIGKVGGAKLFGLNSSNSTKVGLAFAGSVVVARGRQMINVRDAYKEVKLQDARRDLYRTMDRTEKAKINAIVKKRFG